MPGWNSDTGVIFQLDKKTFGLVADRVGAALRETGYEPAKVGDPTEGVVSAVFAGETTAYGVFYIEKKKQFELRTCDAANGGQAGKWKVISAWLFDPETDTAEQANDIAGDFLDTIRGPKQRAIARSKKKRRKDDGDNVDPVFFFNRFVGIFPELKDELNGERDAYGAVRAVTFARGKLLPKIEALCAAGGDGDAVSRCGGLLSDLYKNGDLDVRSIITIVILNSLSEKAVENLKPSFTEDLAKGHRAALRMKGKKVKPEKVKKRTRIMAETLNEMDGKGRK